ncbi:MAG: hypothetical protein J0M01_11330 [Dechloromonas sp.]|jgi:hypothetical protein|nr:hypothetical protein [Dechloromonas sp.]
MTRRMTKTNTTLMIGMAAFVAASFVQACNTATQQIIAAYAFNTSERNES